MRRSFVFKESSVVVSYEQIKTAKNAWVETKGFIQVIVDNFNAWLNTSMIHLCKVYSSNPILAHMASLIMSLGMELPSDKGITYINN